MKRIVLWILVILWMSLIFFFSSFNGKDSARQSKGVLHHTLGVIIELFDKDITLEEKEEIIDKLDKPVRKVFHGCIFFVLGVLVYLLLNTYSIVDKRLIIYSIVICLLYAISDEVHQTFVSERSGEIRDVIIDTLGSTIGIFLTNLFKKD